MFEEAGSTTPRSDILEAKPVSASEISECAAREEIGIGEHERLFREEWNAQGPYSISLSFGYKKGDVCFLSNQEIFDNFERFWSDRFSHCVPKQNPICAIAGAQPGSGKTRLVAMLSHDGEIAYFPGDDYRTYHPRYDELKNRPDYTQATAAINTTMHKLCFARALDMRIDCVVEMNMRRTGLICDMIEDAKRRGFGVDIALLLVPKNVSYLGTYNRAVELVEGGQELRIVEDYVHDGAFDGVKDFIDQRETLAKLNSLRLYSRELVPLYEAHEISANKIAKIREEAMAIIERERVRRYPDGSKERNEYKLQKRHVIEHIRSYPSFPITEEDFRAKLRERKPDGCSRVG